MSGRRNEAVISENTVCRRQTARLKIHVCDMLSREQLDGNEFEVVVTRHCSSQKCFNYYKERPYCEINFLLIELLALNIMGYLVLNLTPHP